MTAGCGSNSEARKRHAPPEPAPMSPEAVAAVRAALGEVACLIDDTATTVGDALRIVREAYP